MKKIKNLTIFILMTTIIMILNTKVEATTGKINSETVRVRSEASTKSNIVTQLDKNDEIEVLEQSEGWYKVTFTKNGKKMNGYISEKLVDVEGNSEEGKEEEGQKEQPKEEIKTEPTEKVEESNNEKKEEIITNDITANIEENKEYTLSQKIEIKILPVINSIEVSQIESGNIKTIEIINDWCRIETDTQTGWIRNNILKRAISSGSDEVATTETNNSTENNNKNPEPEKQPEEKKPEEVKEEKVIKTAYVSTESLKVRKEANTSSDVIDSLKQNDKVSILEELDGWYKIKISGEIGYVSSKYISDTKVPETTSRGTNTQRVENVTEIQQETKNENVAASTGTSGDAVVAYAKQYLGYKYVSGGAAPSTGFDCSGFTSYVYKNFGVKLNRTSRDQIKNGVAVDRSNLQPGDIVVFNGESNKTIGHVGIYIGGGDFIHASNPKGGVKITPLNSSYYDSRYVGARRVI